MASITLTDKGKRAASDLRVHGAGARVIRYLNNHGASSPHEIADGMSVSPQKALRLAAMLYKKGYVEKC